MVGAKDRGIGYVVFVGGRSIGADELRHPVGNDDIRIAPIVMGSKSGGMF